MSVLYSRFCLCFQDQKHFRKGHILILGMPLATSLAEITSSYLDQIWIEYSLTLFCRSVCRESWDQNVAPQGSEFSNNIVGSQEHQNVEWQALNLLVSEASSRQGDRIELPVQEGASQEHSDSVFVVDSEQSPTVEEEKLVPKIVFLAMSDNKQSQPQPQSQQQPQQALPQPQQQAAAVLDQNVQQVQVQVSASSPIRIWGTLTTTITTTTSSSEEINVLQDI